MLRQNQNRDDSKLVERTEQLMHLQDEKALLRHRIHIAVQAIDDDDTDRIVLYTVSDNVGKFARRHLGRIDLLHTDLAGVDLPLQRHAKPRTPGKARARTFLESEYANRCALLHSAYL